MKLDYLYIGYMGLQTDSKIADRVNIKRGVFLEMENTAKI
jgi:hypothetical protein